MTKLSKSELIQLVAAQTDLPKSTVAGIVDSVVENIVDGLESGVVVDLFGFGNFKPVAKPARTGRNPSTGAAIQLPAKTVVKFTPAKALKDRLNGQ